MNEPNTPTGHLTEETPCGRLDEIIADYLEAVEIGAAPPRQELLAAHPELASELTAFLADQDRLEAVVAPLVGRSSTGGGRTGTVSLQPGQRIGRYELLEELGRGGMGIVYKARQLGANRLVALKMIGAGSWATPDELKRFRLEAESIAELDHPNIVPLYEVGEEDSRAYYSMKWIEGGSLAGQIEHLQGRPREAVRLLLAVAHAVDHAHQHGVLHRDLKPANILLQEKAETKRTAASSAPGFRLSDFEPFVSDFGLAKKLAGAEPASSDRTIPAAPTLSGTALGTPSYMAPEQARNARVATMTADVYSLGAILYECLTGRPPFRAATSLETLLDVLEREPDAPSRLCAEVDRDLDTICLKCLQKEPNKRYPSAAALASDLERYLAGEPILARPVGRGERFLRWTRRQPVVATLTAGVVLSVLVGVILVLIQWRQAEEARESAEIERVNAVAAQETSEVERGKAQEATKQAEFHLGQAIRERSETDAAYRQAHQAVADFCNGLSGEEFSQYPALLPLRKRLLESGLKYYESFLKHNEKDRKLRRDVAEAHFRIGLLNAVVGTRSEALASYEKALAAYRALHAEEPKEAAHERMLAQTLTNMANQQSAVGRTTEVRKSLTELRTILEKLSKRFPRDIGLKKSTSIVLNNLRALDGEVGKASADPVRTGEEVVAMRKKLLEQSPESEDHQALLAQGLYNLGLTYNTFRRGEDARRCWEEARTLQDKLVDQHGNNPRNRRDLALTCRHLGNWYTGRKQLPAAMKLYAKGRLLLEELTHDHPDMLTYQSDLASMHADIGSAFHRNAQYDKALAEMNLALEMRKKLVERRADDTLLQVALGQSYHNLGNLHRTATRTAEALASYRKAEETFRKLTKQNPDSFAFRNYLAGALNNLGDVLQKVNRSAEGLKAFEECVSLERMVFDAAPGEREYRESLSMYSRNLSRAYRLDHRPAEAIGVTLRQRELWLDNGNELARLLRDFQLAAQLVPNKSAERKRYLDQGIETLALALAAGYRDFDRLRKDPDLALLRQGDEFERLLRTHEMK